MEETDGPNGKYYKRAQSLNKARWPMHMNDVPQVQPRDQIRSNLESREVSDGSFIPPQFTSKTFEPSPKSKKTTPTGEKKVKVGKSGHDSQQRQHNAKASYISKKERERRQLKQLKSLDSEAAISSSHGSRKNSNVWGNLGRG
jgi:hypothetical protein